MPAATGMTSAPLRIHGRRSKHRCADQNRRCWKVSPHIHHPTLLHFLPTYKTPMPRKEFRLVIPCTSSPRRAPFAYHFFQANRIWVSYSSDSPQTPRFPSVAVDISREGVAIRALREEWSERLSLTLGLLSRNSITRWKGSTQFSTSRFRNPNRRAAALAHDELL
jgi:hypothetical protein